MTYFNDKKNVEDYIKMSKGFDGRELIDILRKFLPDGSKVLELGMGPGKDYEILEENFKVTGSDYSKVFVERYKKINNEADIIQLDAISIETDQRFDCIYTNKVLIHLTREELERSLQRQQKVLLENGLAFHTFWHGSKEDEEFHGLRFVYYTIDELKKIIEKYFEIIEIKKYKESKKDDSIYVIFKRK